MSWTNEEDRSDGIQRGNSWSDPRSLIIIFVRLVRALSRAQRAFLKDPRPTCSVGVLEFSSVFILFCFSLATIVLGRNLGSNAGEKDFNDVKMCYRTWKNRSGVWSSDRRKREWEVFQSFWLFQGRDSTSTRRWPTIEEETD